jgi:hypothetical protein
MDMRPRARALLLPILVAAGGALLLAWMALKTPAFTDYEVELEPSATALRHGHIHDFLAALPAYGGSLVLRSPFAFLPNLWGGGSLALFRSLAAPCLAAGAALGVYLWAQAERLGRGRVAAWTALCLCAINPLTLRALETGHPEELLGGALCVAAALAARRHQGIAGLLLGLAVANKAWAVLAVIPIALIAPERRALLIGAAGATAAVILGPLLVAGSQEVRTASSAAPNTGQIFQPWQVWWFLGDHGHVVRGAFGVKPDYRAAPGWIGHVGKPAVLLVPTLLSLALAPRLRRRGWHDALLLLVLVLLLRCILDPWNVIYYELPFLLALVAWEVHARDGAPVISLAVTILCWVTLEQLTHQASPDVQSAAFLAWSVPLALLLAVRLFDPQRLRVPLLPELLQVSLEGQRGRRA